MRLVKSALAMSIVSVLTACGGDSNSTSDNTTATSNSTLEVTAVDGYLWGAFVWLDIDSDGLPDNGEPSGTTGAGGKVELDVTGIDNPDQYPIVVRAIQNETRDIGEESDATFESGTVVTEDYVMTAPAGETVITPFSTLVHIKQQSGEADSKESALQQVAEELGLEADKLLGDFIIDNSGSEYTNLARLIVQAEVLPKTTTELVENLSADPVPSQTTDVTDRLEKLSVIVTGGEFDPSSDYVSFNDSGDASKVSVDQAADDDDDGIPNFLDKFNDAASDLLDDDYIPSANDIDEDGIGDNMDDDRDGDGISNEEDFMPNDPSESKDSDNDGIGNNEDEDDDNDGILDVADIDPLDATIGKVEDGEIETFFANNDVVYELWGDNDFDHPSLERLSYTLTEGEQTWVATYTDIQLLEFNEDDSVTWNTDHQVQDIFLSSSGWVSVDPNVVLTYDGTNWSANITDGGDLDISYSVTGGPIDLEGKNVSQYIQYWPFTNQSDTFSSGAQALTFTARTTSDVYRLYDTLYGSSSSTPTSLNALIVSSDTTTDSETANSVDGVFLSESIVVELSDDNKTQFFKLNEDQSYSLIKTDAGDTVTGEWAETTVSNTEMIELELPMQIVNRIGQDSLGSNTVVFSSFSGSLYTGFKEVHAQGGTNVGTFSMVNSTALADYQAALRSSFVCYEGDTWKNSQESNASEADFTAAIEACGGKLELTNSMFEGNSYLRTRGDGVRTEEFYFAPDGEATVVKNGDLTDHYSVTWSIASDILTINLEDGGTWQWALIDTIDDQYAFTTYEEWAEDNQTMSEVWSEDFTLTKDKEFCRVDDDSINSVASLESELSAYYDCQGVSSPQLQTSDLTLPDQAFAWHDDNGHYSTLFSFRDDMTGYEVHNGISYGDFEWSISDNGNVIELGWDGVTEAHFGVLDIDESGMYVVEYWEGDDDAWSHKLSTIGTDIYNCDRASSRDEFDDDAGAPATTSSYAEYLTAVSSCISEQNFSSIMYMPRVADDLIEDSEVVVMKRVDEDISDPETIIFDVDDVNGQSGDAKLIIPASGNDPEEIFSGDWVLIEDDNGVGYQTTFSNESVTAQFIFYIVDVGGNKFVLKSFEQVTAWDTANTIGINNNGFMSNWTVEFTLDAKVNHFN